VFEWIFTSVLTLYKPNKHLTSHGFHQTLSFSWAGGEDGKHHLLLFNRSDPQFNELSIKHSTHIYGKWLLCCLLSIFLRFNNYVLLISFVLEMLEEDSGFVQRSRHTAHYRSMHQRSSMCFTVAWFCAVQCKHPALQHDLEKSSYFLNNPNNSWQISKILCLLQEFIFYVKMHVSLHWCTWHFFCNTLKSNVCCNAALYIFY